MSASIFINRVSSPDAGYITWTPAPCTITVTGIASPLNILLRNKTASGGQVSFMTSPAGPEKDTLQLTVDPGGAPVEFFIAGKYPHASTRDKDAIIDMVNVETGQSIATRELMVRIRKNAEKLTPEERDLFIDVMSTLNASGEYQSIRETHQDSMSTQAHRQPGFLPWHRAYLLDLERTMQQVSSAVTLPYWKFDEPAPKLFTSEFIGQSVNGSVRFTPGHKFGGWRTDGVIGIVRTPRFNQQSGVSLAIAEEATLNLASPNHRFNGFTIMEGPAHDRAHGSFGGFVGSVETAARDPLFFLLHANVDRLWAKWQWLHRRFIPADENAYSPQGAAGNGGTAREGHNALDTMWPWNQIMNGTRPNFISRGLFPSLTFTRAPASKPAIMEMIDYQGEENPDNYLGYDYDDIFS